MQTVTSDFKAAAVAATNTPVRIAMLTLADNDILAGNLTPTANTIDSTIAAATKAVNGIKTSTAHWAFADPFTSLGAGARCFPADNLYPIGTADEAGWWGSAASDGSGNVSSETFLITYSTPVQVQTAYWIANAWTGYLVNFVVSYDATGVGSFTTLATVTGNAATTWSQDFGGLTTIYALKIVITKIQYPDAVSVLVEFGAKLDVDITSRLVDTNVLVERSPDNSTIEIGDVSAGELTLTLDNTDGYFSPHNSASPYYGLLRANRRIALQVGFQYDNGSTEYVPFGVYYTLSWSAIGGEPTATVTAQDRMKRLRERKYKTAPLLTNQTADQVVIAILQDFGMAPVEYVVNPSTVTIAYAWCSPDESYLDYLSQVAEAVGGVVYMDENNIFHFEDAGFLRRNKQTSVLTLTDSVGIFRPIDDWNEGDVKNEADVQNNAVTVAALGQIWSLSETLTIPNKGTLTYFVTFSSAATNVQTPVLADVDAGISIKSWTVYGQSAILVLQCSISKIASGSGPVIVANSQARSITVQGQALQTNGNSVITAQDAVFANIDGPRPISINNQFIQTTAAATKLAQDLVILYKNPPAKINMEIQGQPHLELGDRVTVNSTIAGINADFWVTRHNLNESNSGPFQSVIDAVACVDQGPTRATMFHIESTVLTGGTLTVNQSASDPYGQFVSFTTPADGNSFTNSFFLMSGWYTFYVMGLYVSTGGIVDWYIDGTLIGSMGWMYFSGSSQVIQTIDVAISYDGYHVLKGIMNGSSGAGHDLWLTKMWLKQVAD